MRRSHTDIPGQMLIDWTTASIEPPVVRKENVLFLVWAPENTKDSVVAAVAERLVGQMPGVKLSVHPVKDGGDSVTVMDYLPQSNRRVFLLVDFEHRDPGKLDQLTMPPAHRGEIEALVFSRDTGWGITDRDLRLKIDQFPSAYTLGKEGEQPFHTVRSTLEKIIRAGIG